MDGEVADDTSDNYNYVEDDDQPRADIDPSTSQRPRMRIKGHNCTKDRYKNDFDNDTPFKGIPKILLITFYIITQLLWIALNIEHDAVEVILEIDVGGTVVLDCYVAVR